MDWNPHELDEACHVLTSLTADGNATAPTALASGILRLRCSDSLRFRGDLPSPRTPGSHFMRHLFHVLGCPVDVVARWRFEHKLMQALLVHSMCPGVVPVTVGLSSELSSSSPSEWHKRLKHLSREGFIVKRALGEASGELGRLDCLTEALREETVVTSDDTTSVLREKYVIQRRIRIAQEFRVHTFETHIIPGLTVPRHAACIPVPDSLRQVEAFVRSVLVRLPAALTSRLMCGWDVARTDADEHYIIEANPAGRHPVFKPGFHCSGYFQLPGTAPPMIARFLRFLEKNYDLTVQLALDSTSDSSDCGLYWWITQCLSVIRAAEELARPLSPCLPQQDSVSFLPRFGHNTSPERQIFEWALAELGIHCGPLTAVPELADPYTKETPQSSQISAAVHGRVLAWGRGRAGSASLATVDELIAARASVSPDSPAIATAGRVTTYGTMDAYAEHLASRLSALGVEPEEPVALLVRRTAYLPIGMLGIWRAGAAYVPLDLDGPRERLERILLHSGVRTVVTDAAMMAEVAAFGVRVLAIDSPLSRGLLPRRVSASRDRLAYVIYTSGSTGAPKGVAVSHGSLANIVLDIVNRIELRSEDKWIAATTASFDIAVLELLAVLTVGGQVILTTNSAISGGRDLLATVASGVGTVMQATPVVWQLLFDAGWSGSTKLKAISGGEALREGLAEKLRKGTKVAWNMYGPTETTVWSTAWQLTDPLQSVSIGQPLTNTNVYVLDDELRLRQPGEIGELYIGGHGLARGYWNQPSLTSCRFVADPFGEPGCRMYRTGDVVRWREDGTLEYRGRTDSQWKINGVRIESSEVEAALACHPDVREVIVEARPDGSGRLALVAFMVLREGTSFDISNVRTFLANKLPPSMCPREVHRLDGFPRLLNGKVDRASLVAMCRLDRLAPIPPTGDTEKRLLSIWSSVFGRASIGSEDRFLELGGDSVSAVRCVNRIADVFGIDVPIAVLLSHDASLRRVASLIEEMQETLKIRVQH